MNAVAEKVSGECIGVGAPDADLLPEDLRRIIRDALLPIRVGERILAIVPDKTRDDNTDLLDFAVLDVNMNLGLLARHPINKSQHYDKIKSEFPSLNSIKHP